jgi:predicted protein tyrosine phosphatase
MLQGVMPRLLVTPLSALEETISLHRPSHLVSLLSPAHMIATPADFPAGRHLKLGVNDVADAALGEHPPARGHVDALLAFARDWDGRAPLLIHCWAGISRSMASAFIILCDRLGEGREEQIARAMRRRAPHAAPNSLFVAHADAALNRKGRMIAALQAMGPARMVEEGVLTELPLEEL